MIFTFLELSELSLISVVPFQPLRCNSIDTLLKDGSDMMLGTYCVLAAFGPNCPRELSPQPHKDPSFFIPIVCLAPQLTLSHSLLSTSIGSIEDATDPPTPNCP